MNNICSSPCLFNWVFPMNGSVLTQSNHCAHELESIVQHGNDLLPNERNAHDYLRARPSDKNKILFS